MSYFNELSTEPVYRARPTTALPGSETYTDGLHTARISYQRGYSADGWQARYFRTHGEARQCRHTFIRAGYRVVVEYRMSNGTWED